MSMLFKTSMMRIMLYCMQMDSLSGFIVYKTACLCLEAGLVHCGRGTSRMSCQAGSLMENCRSA